MGYGTYEGDHRPGSPFDNEAKADKEPQQPKPQPQPNAQTQQQQKPAKEEKPHMNNQHQQEFDPMDLLINQSAALGRGERSHSSDPRATAFRNAFSTAYENQRNNGECALDVQFVIMNADIISGQSLSTIVAYTTIDTRDGKRMTVFRPMVLNAKRDRRTSRQIQFNQTSVQIDQRPQDLARTDYVSKVGAYVARIVPNFGTVVNAGIFELPTSLDPSDEDAVARILIDNETRMQDAVSYAADTRRLTLSDLARTKASLVVTPEYGNTVKTTVAGSPVRADVTVTMSARVRSTQQAQPQQNMPNQYQQDNMVTIELNSLSGFIDTVPYRAIEQQQPMFPGAQPNTQCFSAFFVITNCSQGSAINANTMESFGLALSNMYYITANGSWLQTYAAKFDGSRNLNDPTAMGYWINGQRFTDNGKEITDMNTIQCLLKMYLKGEPTVAVPGIGFMMDINPTGDNALLELPFLEIAMNTANAAKAQSYVIRAFDNLTGGGFSRNYKSTDPLVTFTGNLVSLGSYTSQTGEKRDVRDMSTLAMLNLTEGKQEDFRRWFDTTDSSLNGETMLRIRESVDKRYTGPNTEFDGYACRVAWNPAAIVALYNAVRSSGVNILFQDNNYQNQQMYFGNQNLSNSLVNTMAASGVGTQGQGWTAQTQNFYGGQNGGNLYY